MIEAGKAEYLDLLLSLLPQGNIAKDAQSNNAQILGIMADEFSKIDSRARALLDEADPRTTSDLFELWRTFAGLPDSCSLDAETLQEKRTRLIQKLTSEGGQSRSYYEGIAEDLGYDVTITEHRPFTCGISECSPSGEGFDISIMNEEHRFVWSVTVHGDRLTWFTCGESELGTETLLTISAATDLECIFNKLKQSHTNVQFIYEEA